MEKEGRREKVEDKGGEYRGRRGREAERLEGFGESMGGYGREEGKWKGKGREGKGRTLRFEEKGRAPDLVRR